MNPSEFHANRKFADTSCGRIAYIEQGSGPVALFLHGLPLCGYQWRGVIEDLAPVRRCIALDEMGLGYTQVAAGQEVSFAAQARMIAAFLDAAHIEHVDQFVHEETLFLCAPQALYAVNKQVEFTPYRTTFELADTKVGSGHWSR
jgi:hypothetical protein